MQVRVRFFAALREALNTTELGLETQATTVDALRAELRSRGPAFAEALDWGRAVRCSVNHVMVTGEALLPDGAEVAFFPPVTGG